MQEREVLVLRLRERAARCRQSAQGSRVPGIARELEALAQEYDHDADCIAYRIDRVRAALTTSRQ